MERWGYAEQLAEEALKLRDRKRYTMNNAVYAVLDDHNIQEPATRKQLAADIFFHLRLRRRTQLKKIAHGKKFALIQPTLPFS